MNLDDLSAAWNSLRTAALGRGIVAPKKVPKKLRAKVDRAYASWIVERHGYVSVGPAHSLDVFATLALRHQLRIYRGLAAKVRAALGVRSLPNQPPLTGLEKVGRKVDQWNTNFAIGLGVGGAVLVSVLLASRRGRTVYLVAD